MEIKRNLLLVLLLAMVQDGQGENDPKCPEKRPDSLESCSVPSSVHCRYGKQCCCGECYPSLTATCDNGTWYRAVIDACMNPNCPDSDSGENDPKCPEERPDFLSSCSLPSNVPCSYGKQCCCGKCYPSSGFKCNNGTWVGYQSDRCMNPNCPPDSGSNYTWQPEGDEGLSWVSQTDPDSLLPDDLCIQDRFKAWQALQQRGLPNEENMNKMEWEDWGPWCDNNDGFESEKEKDEASDSAKCEGGKRFSVGTAKSDLFCEPNRHCFPNCFHMCMNCTIAYPKEVYGDIPTHGPHRPIWPTWGEYSSLPPQRWLHSVEHGAIVMLYHPCAPKDLVDQLRRIVVGCLRKHIIAPSQRFTSVERPLTLVAWLCRLTMATVNRKEVEDFITLRAHLALEGDYTKDGSFKKNLITKAEEAPNKEVPQVFCKGRPNKSRKARKGKGKGKYWPIIEG